MYALNPRFSLIATILLFLAGCASYNEPHSESISKAIDLSRLDTFHARIHSEPEDTAFGRKARENAMETLLEGFRQRGFSSSEPENADFLVLLASRVQDETETFSTDYSRPAERVVVIKEREANGKVVTTIRDRDVVTTYESQPITVGSMTRLFVIDIVDAETDVLLWRSYMTSDDVELSDPDEIDVYIEKMLEELPDS